MAAAEDQISHYSAALHALQQYCEERSFAGYDPYDILMSPFPFVKLGKWPSVFAIQAFKRNPINLRPLFGVKPSLNPKALGLFLHAYSLLPPNEHNRNICATLFEMLLECRTSGVDGFGWGYQFGWANPVKYLPPYDPTAVVSGFVAKGLEAYYTTYGNAAALDALKQIIVFFEGGLYQTDVSGGIAISYSTRQRDFCYNASLLAAEVYAIVGNLTQNPQLQETALQAVAPVLAVQKQDGHWNYSKNLETGHERVQVDFHQGYIVESLITICERLNFTDPRMLKAIDDGYTFYAKNQFTTEGRAKWRLPAEWPADIHHQAQGIISACVQYRYSGVQQVLETACTIADFTLSEFQDAKGFFYYRKHKYWKDKTPYMRWGQSWMFLALATLLKTLNDSKNQKK